MRIGRAQASLLATIAVAIVLLTGASLRYKGFCTLPVFMNLIDDSAFLGIAAVGMTFVILSGGIDLSVGAMIGLTSIATALLVEHSHVHPLLAAVVVLACGAVFGAIQGVLIARFEIAPFLVTLAGMFFLRGFALTLSLESIALTHPIYRDISQLRLPLGSSSLPFTGALFLLVVALGFFIARWTRFGRGVYAVGGNAASSQLMGLPVARIQILIYALSGTLAALAGIAYTLYTSSGNATAATGLELDVIAAVVIGGTLLTGGQGSVFGTLVGVLILGAIQTIITFEATLSSWWTRIVIGLLLLFFVVLQKTLSSLSQKRLRPATDVSSARATALLALGVFGVSIMSSPARAQLATSPQTDFVCSPGESRGTKMEKGLIQLTGTALKPGPAPAQAVEAFSDPAPPYLTESGEVEIYGSALAFIRYKNLTEFERGGCYRVILLDLRNPDLKPYSEPYSEPWDVRKYRIKEPGRPGFEILIAGSMAAANGHALPIWPDDNINRRLYIYRDDGAHHWVRDLNPLVGISEASWIGHSYGGNLIQVGTKEPWVIYSGRRNPLVLFYERVSDDTGHFPFKTELFMLPMRAYDHPSSRKQEKRIFKIPDPAFPSLKRTIGGTLAEGPRPVEITIKNKKFFIVAFSAGDFPTDFYTMNYLWSRRLEGPYTAALNPDGKDLLDLGRDVKARYGLSWMGRPSIYRASNGEYEMLFHAVKKEWIPNNDYTVWPPGLWDFSRELFKVHLDLGLDPETGAPLLRLKPER